MSNLFIIGNGFDIAHHIKTKYSDFRAYIISKLNNGFGENIFVDRPLHHQDFLEKMPLPNIYAKNQTHRDDQSNLKLLLWLIDRACESDKNPIEWRDFEEDLEKLDFDAILSRFGTSKEAGKAILEAVSDLPGYFFDWIGSVDINCSENQSFIQLIDVDNDFVINFNFTEILETVYGFRPDHILYIHGRRETDPIEKKRKFMTAFGSGNKPLIVGFDCRDERIDKFEKYAADDAYGSIITAYTGLEKPTDDIIKQNMEFFDTIVRSEIRNVYSIGFSYSRPDQLYIREVFKSIHDNRNVRWILNRYNNSEVEQTRIVQQIMKETDCDCDIEYGYMLNNKEG